MKTICSGCGRVTSSVSVVCPDCGQPLTRTPSATPAPKREPLPASKRVFWSSFKINTAIFAVILGFLWYKEGFDLPWWLYLALIVAYLASGGRAYRQDLQAAANRKVVDGD